MLLLVLVETKMNLIEKIISDCQEIERLSKLQPFDELGQDRTYKPNPCPTDFQENINDWAENHGATQDEEGNWSV